MTVLKVPTGEEGGPGGLPNLLKEEVEKKENNDSEEEMEGNMRDDDNMQERLMVEEEVTKRYPSEKGNQSAFTFKLLELH